MTEVLVAFMALGLFGCLIDDDPQGDLEALPGLAMFGGVGAYLWIDGQKRLDKLQACSEAALKSNRQLAIANRNFLSDTPKASNFSLMDFLRSPS